MSPISDNRNLSSDKPVDPQKIERENSYARYGQKRGPIDQYREGGVQLPSQPGAAGSESRQSQPEPHSEPQPQQQGPLGSEKEAPEDGRLFGKGDRPDVFSSMRRPKPLANAVSELSEEREQSGESKEESKEESRKDGQAPSQQKTPEIGDNIIEKKTQKAVPAASTSKVEKKKGEKPAEAVEPVKTVFGNKEYVDKKLIKYNLWKSDDLRQMTKLGRNDRAGLAQELFPERRLVRKDDVKKAIRGIESGKIKPPASLGAGRTGRMRTTNVLRKLIGEKPKKIY